MAMKPPAAAAVLHVNAQGLNVAAGDVRAVARWRVTTPKEETSGMTMPMAPAWWARSMISLAPGAKAPK